MTTLDNSFCQPNTAEEWECLLTNIKSDTWKYRPYYDSVNDYYGYVEEKPAFFYRNKCFTKWFASDDDTLTNEITVSQYIDLLQDNITPWRLEEIGFIRITDRWNIPFHIHVDLNITWHHRNKTIEFEGIEMLGIEKFSQLQNLIKYRQPLNHEK